ncbi:MAG: hypothetical protein Q9195_005628 [Heterodermia aff. obscurata]
MGSAEKTVVLITGGMLIYPSLSCLYLSRKKKLTMSSANGGIGFELAAQLIAKDSYHVLLGSRSSEKGNAAVEELQSRELPGSVELVVIDVTSDESIEQAATAVQNSHGKLDILVNNAAIALPAPPLRKQLNDAFDTNAAGPAVVVEAFASLLKKSTTTPRIINVSSGGGSIGRRLDSSSPSYKMQALQYRASKAALNMITACHWVQYGPEGIKVFTFCPGFTVSNLGQQNKAEFGAKPTDEAVRPLVDIVEGKRDDEAGKFLNATGLYPW